MTTYQKKRDFSKTPEPLFRLRKRKKGELAFVVQKHAATHLHYDLRLEVDGVLKSWAVPKGPSLNPKEKRLAMMVEDHPYDYKDFEGIIPSGYGAGSVIIWDKGSYDVDGKSAKESEKLMKAGLKKGEVHFSLNGEKLKGEFALVHMRKGNQWLLIKKKDKYASIKDVTKLDTSVVSGRSLEEMGGSSKKKISHLIKPMLTTLIDVPFDDENFIFEIKWDGFRAIAELNKNRVNLYSRSFQSFNTLFSSIVEELKKLGLQAIFDGEVVILDKKGRPNFQLLQNAASYQGKLYYYVFDLLYLNGRDLKKLPLIERKKILKGLLSKGGQIRFCDHVEKYGNKFFKVCLKNGLEGIIGKDKRSEYLEGVRSKKWVKIKNKMRQEVIICGFTEPRKSRKHIGSIIAGIYKKGVLHYAGHVGGGFTQKELEEMEKRLAPYVQEKCPFQKSPKTNTKVTWVKPHFLCEVTFQEWTSEGIMRQPIFLGLREDKPAEEVVIEKKKKRKKHEK